MLRKWLIALNAAWIAGLFAFCWANNVSVGGYAFTALGTALRDNGQPRAATLAFSAALYFIPNASRIYGARAYSEMMIKDYDAALRDYTHALELEGPNAHRYHARGNLYFQMKRYTDAIADYKAALALDPQQPDMHRALAATYIRMDDMASAAAEYEKVSNLARMTSRDKYYLKFTSGFARGEAALKANEHGRAAGEFAALLQLNNSGKIVRLADTAFRIALCSKFGHSDCKARVEADRIHALQLAEANGFKTGSYLRAINYNLALQSLIGAERAFETADALIKNRKYSESMASLNKAVTLAGVWPEAGRYLEMRALIRETLGDRFGAYSDREQAEYRKWQPTALQRFTKLEADRQLQEADDE